MLFRLPYALFVNFVLLLLWPLRLWRRARAAPHGAWLTVEIDGPVVEVDRRYPFWDRRPRPVSLHGFRRLVELASNDPRVAGLAVTLKSFHGSSATATSLRDLILSAKAAGKRTAVYLPAGGGTRDMYVACAADRIFLGPETHLAPLGFAVQSPYVKDALDKVGLEPEVFARGRYKTAGEALVLREMSDAQREQVGALLDSAWDELLGALASGRAVSREVAQGWVDGGPWAANAAVGQGLADGVCYEDELTKKLEPRRTDEVALVPGGAYLRRRVLRWRPLFRKPTIAVVEVHGAIVSKSGGPLVEVADEEHVSRALRSTLDDPRVRGVVVHIDSRGGSALASDRMLHALRRVAEKKPVVAYLGDVAASGGYMVAVGAQVIVAQPTTITGSIGVVAARPVIEPLLERIGVAVSVVKRGARADMNSPARHLDEGERAALERQLDDIYGSFLRVVADGRSRPVEEIEKLAGGRVWSGRAASEQGLVDRLGGFDVALAEVRSRIGGRADRFEPSVVSTRRLQPSLSSLVPGMRAAASAVLGDGAALLASAAHERVWAWSPVTEVDLASR